jgi:hypothetical protein
MLVSGEVSSVAYFGECYMTSQRLSITRRYKAADKKAEDKKDKSHSVLALWLLSGCHRAMHGMRVCSLPLSRCLSKQNSLHHAAEQIAATQQEHSAERCNHPLRHALAFLLCARPVIKRFGVAAAVNFKRCVQVVLPSLFVLTAAITLRHE